MILRSWLFIPADSEKKLGKVDSTPADAFLLDMEDSVAPTRKQVAREMLPEFLAARPKAQRQSQLWVRINPFDTPHALDDLAAVMPAAPDGIMLPKSVGPEDVLRLSYYLDAFERAADIEVGTTNIMPLVTETPAAALGISAYAQAQLQRVKALSWGAEDLSSALAATANCDEHGEWDFTYKMVRSQTLLAAHAMGVQALDTLFVDFRDPEGLAASCRVSRREGFSGRMAIHPAQVEAINAGYLPSEEEAALAARIVEAFDAQPDLGTIGIDGKMYDMPHLKQARRTLELYKARA
jgi:citrate lyase subunit beta/citryl-CoA lyase